MENGGVVNPTISPDDVISKLKDDGDFDRLRLKIIRKLKENEELRNSIISVVKESAALNRPGAENMKPRQLSDAIHNEVGEKVMSQISDGIWDIIRSGDHMKTEIKETVKSVYDKLLTPHGNEDGQPLSSNYTVPACKGTDNSGLVAASAGQINGPKEPLGLGHSDNHQNKISDTLDDSESKGPPGFTHSDDHPQKKINDPLGDNESDEPPGFTHSNIHQNNQEEGPCCSDDEDCAPPGFSVVADHKPPCDGSDEDPDMPPGFGG